MEKYLRETLQTHTQRPPRILGGGRLQGNSRFFFTHRGIYACYVKIMWGYYYTARTFFLKVFARLHSTIECDSAEILGKNWMSEYKEHPYNSTFVHLRPDAANLGTAVVCRWAVVRLGRVGEVRKDLRRLCVALSMATSSLTRRV